MACTITIDAASLRATTNATGDIVRIDVEGQVEGCTEIKVELKDETAGISIGTLSPIFPDENNHWVASFVETDGITLKGVACGDKVTVVAECTDEKCKGEHDKADSVSLPCKPGDGGKCPRVNVTVQPGDCNQANTARTMTFEVTVEGGGQIQYRWNFGDGSPQTSLATGSGTFQQTHSYPADDTYFANLNIEVPPGCTADPDPITVEVDPCVAATCPSATLRVTIARNCNADGTRTATFHIGLTNLPAGSPVFGTLHLGDGVPGSGTIPVQFDPAAPGPEWSPQTGGFVGQFAFNYPPGTYQNVSFEITFPAACDTVVPLRDGPLNIAGCTATDCPNALTLAVQDANQHPVRTGPNDPCLPAGDYVVTATPVDAAGSPLDPTGRTYTWSVDNHVDPDPNANGLNRNTNNRTIAAGSTTAVSVAVNTPNCAATLSGGVTLRACDQGNGNGNGGGNGNGAINWCLLWFWINLGLMIVAGVVILVAFCMIDATVWAAIAALASGGTLAAVWTALTAANIAMLIVALALAVFTLVSFILWIIFCVFGPLGSDACPLIGILIGILTVIDMFALILGVVLAVIGNTGCAAGSFVDVAWFSILLSIAWWVGAALGCRLTGDN